MCLLLVQKVEKVQFSRIESLTRLKIPIYIRTNLFVYVRAGPARPGVIILTTTVAVQPINPYRNIPIIYYQ